MKQWMSRSENQSHAYKTGLYAKPTRVVRRLNKSEAIQVLSWHKQGIKQREIALRLGVTEGAVSHIISGRNWKNLSIEETCEDQMSNSQNDEDRVVLLYEQILKRQEVIANRLDSVEQKIDQVINAIDGHFKVLQAQESTISELIKLAGVLEKRSRINEDKSAKSAENSFNG